VESYTVGGQILLSPTTYEKMKSLVKVKDTIKVQFKGIDHQVTLYDIVGIKGKHPLLLLQKESGPFIKLDPPVAISCFTLENKAVSETSISGCITHLSKYVAKASMDQKVEIRSNLKMRISDEKNRELYEGYAKVVSSDSPGSSAQVRAFLEFTWLSDEFREFLEKRRVT
jgi:adenylate cyclase